MSPWLASFLALLVLFSPAILIPRRERREIQGAVRLLWYLNAFYCAFWHRLELVGEDTLPTKGPAILISNHTCCIDHMLLQAATWRLLGFMIAKELYDYWLFTPFCRVGGCIPVRRDGNDIAAMRAALRVLGEGRVVPIFPEGRILPTSGRELGEAKPGVAFIALRAGVPVIPAYLRGTPRTNRVIWSYLTPSHARVSFGPPIDLSDLIREGKAERESFDEVTQRLMAGIRALRDQAQGEEPQQSQSTRMGPPHAGPAIEGRAGVLSVDGATIEPS